MLLVPEVGETPVAESEDEDEDVDVSDNRDLHEEFLRHGIASKRPTSLRPRLHARAASAR